MIPEIPEKILKQMFKQGKPVARKDVPDWYLELNDMIENSPLIQSARKRGQQNK